MGRKRPPSAAAFLAGVPEVPGPAFDSWPPADWFVGVRESGANGRPFDWSAPPADFTIADAYGWVDRVEILYRHLEACGRDWCRENGERASALANAYALVGDLRRRSLVPLAGFRQYRVEMNEYVPGFEVRALGEVRDWLGAAEERRRRRAGRNATRDGRESEISRRAGAAGESAKDRLTADCGGGSVTLGGTRHHVGAVPAAFVSVLLSADDWISLKEIETRISAALNGLEVKHLEREKKKLPECVQATIEAGPKGHRLKPPHRRP